MTDDTAHRGGPVGGRRCRHPPGHPPRRGGRRSAGTWAPRSSRPRGGYRALLAWLRGFGTAGRVGVEGTGSYGAGLARLLHAQASPWSRSTGPTAGPAAARASPTRSTPTPPPAPRWPGRTAVPKTRDRTGRGDPRAAGRPPRRGQGPHRTREPAQIPDRHRPEPLREPAGRPPAPADQRLRRAAPDADPLGRPRQATRAALRALAAASSTSTARSPTSTPTTHARHRDRAPPTAALGVGPDTAGQLLATAGDNPDRLGTEAALAHLCGAAPIPASSGRPTGTASTAAATAANRALHTIALCRMRSRPPHPRLRRTPHQQGLTKKDILRCLKRYIAREVHNPTRRLAPRRPRTP